MPWPTEGETPSWRGSHAEFWIDEELVLAVSSIDIVPAEGQYVTYINLAEEEVHCRIADVTFILREEREVPDSTDLSPGTPHLSLRPTVKIEMQAVP
jgi:hypothetical protein